MSSKKFLVNYIIISLAIILTIVGVNYYIDIYGLFRGKKERKVYINERTSKYLFSMRYIPENFEGVIIGPSLSANLNPDYIKDYKIYNASIMGANISELKLLIDNIISKGHMKFAIICIGPYLVKDHGRKSASIDPKEYYGALGSTNLLKTYLLYEVRKHHIATGRYAPNLFNTLGWNNFELEMNGLDPEKTIREKVRLGDYGHIETDSIALKELDQTVKELRRNNIKVIGYFSPVPYDIYQLGRSYYHNFEQNAGKIFNDSDILINLNAEEYASVNKDYNTFIDHGHLSSKGQAFVLAKLDSVLRSIYPRR